MASHVDLLTELQLLEKVPTLERLRAAQKRRAQQLKKWAQYEQDLLHRKRKHERKRSTGGRRKKVSFEASVALLEASLRNDAEEGKAPCSRARTEQGQANSELLLRSSVGHPISPHYAEDGPRKDFSPTPETISCSPGRPPLVMQLSMTFDFWPSCLYFPGAGIAGRCHRASLPTPQPWLDPRRLFSLLETMSPAFG